MVQSRLGDVYEQLGSIDAALRAYRAAAAHPVPVVLVTTILRDQLKLRYYEGTRPDGDWATQASRDRLFGYIKDFQSPEAFAEFTRRCEGDARFEVCRAKLVEKRFNEVSARMKADLQAGRR